MLSFSSDYIEGAHPKILERLMETNMEQEPGYGFDSYCISARDKIRKAVENEAADVFFISGGTQTNRLIISTMLPPYGAVLAADTGHINGHEAGAIEASGHRVLPLPQVNGKISAASVSEYMDGFVADDNHEHMTQPGMVYISFPTERGTIYSKKELTELYAACKKYALTLFIDGARLGYGLASPECDLTLPEFASLCDVFYIGGTKVGALLGEAVVFTGKPAPAHFFTSVKQNGALLAKGRVLGLQFDTLFTDGLYMQISRHAIEMAYKVREILKEKGLPFFIDSPTNQQFVIIDNDRYKKLSEKVSVGFWCAYDEHHTVIRVATSWATLPENVEKLCEIL